MSDYHDYGDTDPNNIPDGEQNVAASVSGPGPTPPSDGLPGSQVDGHPAWRVGVFASRRNVLGLVPASNLAARDDIALETSLSGASRAMSGGLGDPRLMRVSDPVLDQEQNSWRWNDPDALTYDLDRKQRQLAEARNLATAAGLVGKGQSALAGARAATGVGILSTLPATAASAGVGFYMKNVEAPRIQGEIDVLQGRLNQLRAGPRA